MASDYEMQPSQSLVKLIQSGKLKYPAWALPKPIMEEEISKSGDTVIKVGSDGKVTTSQQLKPKPLANLEELVEVFMCAIMPALIEKPRALMDWGALVRSVVQLSRTHSWAAAHKFLSQTLASKINAREAFGDFDIVILTNVVATTDHSSTPNSNARHARNKQAQATQSSTFVDKADSSKPSGNKTICTAFNFRTCNRTNCPFPHRCAFWEQCKNDAPDHKGIDCQHNPRNANRGGQGGSLPTKKEAGSG
jgi:hypothetical protein